MILFTDLILIPIDNPSTNIAVTEGHSVFLQGSEVEVEVSLGLMCSQLPSVTEMFWTLIFKIL